MKLRLPSFLGGFRIRLVVLLISALVPGIVLNVVLAQNLRESKEAEIVAQAEILAEAVAAIQELQISNTEALLRGMVQESVIRDLPESGLDNCSVFLEALLRGHPQYANFGVFDKNGIGMCNARGTPPGRDNSDRLYYLETVRLNGFAAGDYQIGRTSGVPGINFGFPIHDDDEVLVGIVFAALPVTSLGELISNQLVPEAATVTLADGNGTVLVRVPEDEALIGDKDVLQLLISEHRSGMSEAFVDGFTEEGVRDFISIVEVPLAPGQPPGFVILSAPSDLVFASVNTTTRNATIAIAIVLALVLTIALFALEIMAIRPVKTLTRAANSLAGGELQSRTGLSHAAGELGQLASSFDDMASSLEESAVRTDAAELSLKNARERAETLARIGRIVSSSPNIEDVFEEVGEEIRKLIPVDRLVLSKIKGVPPVATDVSIFGIEDPNRPIGSTTLIEGNLWNSAVETGGALVFDHTNIDEYFPDRDLETQGELYKKLSSHLVTPLVSRGEIAGALSYRSFQRDIYGEYQIETAKEIAAQISGAIANAELRENVQSESSRRELLARIGRTITSAPSIEETYPELVGELSSVVPFDRFTFRSVDHENDVFLDLFIGGRVAQSNEETDYYVISTSALNTLLEKPKPTALHGDELKSWAAEDPPQLAWFESGMVSMMVVPVHWQDESIAVMVLRSEKEEAYTDAHVDLMGQVADHMAGAIANADVYRQTVELAHKLEEAAFTDPITGLANRAGVESAVADIIGLTEVTAASIISAELGRIRELEDRFGSSFVSSVLQAIGQRLTSGNAPPETVGRVNDDTFVFCRPGRKIAMAWQGAAEELRESLQEPFEIDGERFALDISVGVALYPGHGRESSDLVRKSVLASRTARLSATGVAMFTADLEDQATDHVRTLTNFRQGWNQGELELHYQPKIDLTTGKIASAEALIRWNSPEQGMVYPGIFMPVLEDSGYMWEFTSWTLAEAFERIHLISEDALGADWEPVPIAINVSATDFQDSRLPGVIAGSLNLWNVDPALVEIEVTETAMMTSPEKAIDVCNELKSLGVSIAIDDFGAGQSPLAYLGKFNVDVIKIDMAFVTDIHKNKEMRTIVEAMVGLATQLGKKVVAEGVEIQEEADVLTDIGCHLGQGYLWARPMPAADFQQLLQNGLEMPIRS